MQSGFLFSASGLLGTNYDGQTSYYRVGSMIEILREAAFERNVASGNPKVRIMEMSDAAGRSYFVLWTPTEDGTVVNGYSLAVPAGSVTLQTPASGETAGSTGYGVDPIVTSLLPNGGTVSIDVSESPIVVVVDP